jgi:hypothetical protein
MCKLGTLIEQGRDGSLVPVALKPIIPLSQRPRIVFMVASASISNNCRRDPGGCHSRTEKFSMLSMTNAPRVARSATERRYVGLGQKLLGHWNMRAKSFAWRVVNRSSGWQVETMTAAA